MQKQGIDLSGLKDIHLPEIPSVFPLPLQFWIVLFGLIGLCFLGRFLWVFVHRITVKKYANNEIEKIIENNKDNNHQIAVELSLLLRRVAMLKYPDENISTLTGEKWQDFLEKTSKNHLFQASAGDIIKTVTYIPADTFQYDVSTLIADTKKWIIENG